MTLNDSFYNEVFEKEKYWMELANKKLLNIYYLNGKGGIRDFYLDKKNKLEEEYENSEMTKIVLDNINNIISKIDSLTVDYRRGNVVDLNSLLTLFLINNINQVKKDNKMSDIEKLQIQKQVLRSLSKSYKSHEFDEYADDYLYEEPDYKSKSA